tara:strand:- start:144 stop:416 length:273 start_codon:yes stop_codon:yes gene_type:complete
MKRLQLPKNKFARLAINIFIIVFWFFLSAFLWEKFDKYGINYNRALWDFSNKFYIWRFPLYYLIIFITPSFLISRLIWFPKRPRITRSKD